jgi:multiple sugar transport system ATP-binding protein
MDAGSERTPNALHGRVDAAEHLGDTTYLYLTVAGAAQTVVVRADPDNALAIGDLAHIGLPPPRCYLFAPDGKALPRSA